MKHHKTEINKALFSAWVSDPPGISNADSSELESMLRAYPYCQALHSLNAKKAQGVPGIDSASLLGRAALYAPDRRVLFNLFNHPERLQEVGASIPAETDNYYEVIEEDYYAADEQPAELQDEEINIPEHPPVPDEEVLEINSSSKEEGEQIAAKDAEDKMILENIAAADFFAFDEKIIQAEAATVNSQDAREIEEPTGDAVLTGPDDTASIQDVARYDDDSMPYSFLWWLHKTRNEHAHTYQPYVDFKLDTSQKITKRSGVELNQQIIENIFHLQSPLDEMENETLPQTVHFEVKRKEEEIIEKFIREEPQIHPPSPDKLDMENKARKSAEDPNDLVSETLAAIYTDQMLFHKAIDTYQKLSLKFPEKRAYFADQISELEKKIN